MPPRSFRVQNRITRLGGRPRGVESVARVSPAEGAELLATQNGFEAVWTKICDMNGLGPEVEACAHIRAAIRLICLPPDGLAPLDRTIFARAGLPVADIGAEAGDVRTAEQIVAHARTGCSWPGTLNIRVAFADPRPEDPTPEFPPDATVVPVTTFEANIYDQHRRALVDHVRRWMQLAGIERPACYCVLSAARRMLAPSLPGQVEAVVMARSGVQIQSFEDPTVERWLKITGDDGTLKAHVDSCPHTYRPGVWPKVVLSPDGALRPIRTASGLEWPVPCWS